MTSYVSRGPGAKKIEALKQVETALRDAIRKESDLRVLKKLAEKVREAKLGVVKALLFRATSNPTYEDRSLEVARLEQEQRLWRERNVDDVIDEYS